jgi:hypothetical protein
MRRNTGLGSATCIFRERRWCRAVRQAGAAIFVFCLSGVVSLSATDHTLNFYHTLSAGHQSELGAPLFPENIEIPKFPICIESSGIILNCINVVLRERAPIRNNDTFVVRRVYCNPRFVEWRRFKSWSGGMRFNGYTRPMPYIASWGLTKVFVIENRFRNCADIKLWGAFKGNSNISTQLVSGGLVYASYQITSSDPQKDSGERERERRIVNAAMIASALSCVKCPKQTR